LEVSPDIAFFAFRQRSAAEEYMRRISETTSTYLNVLRFLTATGVVLFHFRDKDFGPAWLTGFFPSQGQSFVVVFFVLSGFFVTMMAEQKSLGEFALDRTIRIYIVALPVLVFTSVLSVAAPSISTTDEYAFAVQHPVATFFLSASFLSQSWWLYVVPFVDGPYWSLPFEVFYYFIFASFTYASGWRRWVLLAAICLIAGPKILLRFPCWIVGAMAYKYRGASTNGWVWAILAPIVLLVSFRLGLKDASNHLNDYLMFEGDTTLRGLFPEGFIRHWFVAGAFAVHIWGVCSIKQNFPAMVSRWANELAGMSYSLYLLHMPLLYLLGAVVLSDRRSLAFLIIALPVIFLGSYLLSICTEGQRSKVKQRLLAAFEGLPVTQAPASRGGP
jgi:peptidoglycan/LPS O-acetylase OafA/YrhL